LPASDPRRNGGGGVVGGGVGGGGVVGGGGDNLVLSPRDLRPASRPARRNAIRGVRSITMSAAATRKAKEAVDKAKAPP
jgi:hypothetical protein